METVLVLYKPNFISGIGGTHPVGVDILGQFGEWVIASCDINDINAYDEFSFIIVDSKYTDGIKGVISKNVSVLEGIPSEEPSFTDEELNAQKYLTNISLKTSVRAEIQVIKDIEDDLVDLKLMTQSLAIIALDIWSRKTDKEKSASTHKDIMNSLGTLLGSNASSLLVNDFLSTQDKLTRAIANEKLIEELVMTKYLNNKV